jgi:hypothetical protein
MVLQAAAANMDKAVRDMAEHRNTDRRVLECSKVLTEAECRDKADRNMAEQANTDNRAVMAAANMDKEAYNMEEQDNTVAEDNMAHRIPECMDKGAPNIADRNLDKDTAAEWGHNMKPDHTAREGMANSTDKGHQECTGRNTDEDNLPVVAVMAAMAMKDTDRSMEDLSRAGMEEVKDMVRNTPIRVKEKEDEIQDGM